MSKAKLMAAIMASEKAQLRKGLEHYAEQGNRANELYQLVTDTWADTCAEMGFTTQSVNGWRRLSNGWGTIKARVEEGTIQTLRQALDALKKPKAEGTGTGDSISKKVERLGQVSEVLLTNYGLTRGQILGILKDVSELVKSKTLLELREYIEDTAEERKQAA
jgi:hypothetical protein